MDDLVLEFLLLFELCLCFMGSQYYRLIYISRLEDWSAILVGDVRDDCF